MDVHWNSMWADIELKENGMINYPYDLNTYLQPLNGRTVHDTRYEYIRPIMGIEFDSEEDLLFFKLKFN